MSNHAMKRLRAHGEAREIRDQEWLRLHQEGKSTSAIAGAAGVSVQLVRRALAQARERDACRDQDDPGMYILPIRPEGGPEAPAVPAPLRTPWWLELVPIFPIGAYTPASECPHRGPLPRGSLLCCMVCSSSGMDHHPSMQRDPATEPPAEPRKRRPRVVHPASGMPTGETRRQRRARKFPGDTNAGSQNAPAA